MSATHAGLESPLDLDDEPAREPHQARFHARRRQQRLDPPHAGAGLDGVGKPDAVHAVVDGAGDPADLGDLPPEVRHQRQGEEPVGDGGPVGRLRRRAGAVDVDPLRVKGHLGEPIDHLLGHRQPLARTDLAARQRLERIEAVDYTHANSIVLCKILLCLSGRGLATCPATLQSPPCAASPCLQIQPESLPWGASGDAAIGAVRRGRLG